MTDDRNRYQITRIDAKNCFVESLSDTFSYGKAHLTFCTYDKSRPEGQRMTANIQIYIDIADWLELCRMLDSGELRAAVAAQNRSGSRDPIKEWLGGTSVKKLAKLGLADLCDFLVSSEEAAAEKPDRAIFELCRKKAGCRAEECLFIGDNPTCDIQGALDAGMQGLWLVHKPEALARHPGLPFVTAPDQIAARIGLELPAGN